MSLELKIEAAAAALEIVEEGMRLGIGTGSTADEFTKLLGAKVAEGFEIKGVPTSERTKALCESLSVPITTLDEMPELDLVIDGADEVDPSFQLIKGAGGALLREKIVASASERMAVIVDDSKMVDALGSNFPLPIEVNPFGLNVTSRAIQKVALELGLSEKITLRGGASPFITDGGHYIIDASFGHISDASALSDSLLNIPGVVEHGLFLGYANVVFLAGQSGVRRL